MNIIIDPHMFELEDEEEIRNNIPFFQTLIFLCKSGRIRIFLYNLNSPRIILGVL